MRENDRFRTLKGLFRPRDHEDNEWIGKFFLSVKAHFYLYCLQPYYIAPEVFLQNYNSKIDIWSLGVVLYIMLSGKVPFPGNSELEIIGNVIKGDFHFNHEPFSRHSPEAKEFLQCLIKKDVNSRFTAE